MADGVYLGFDFGMKRIGCAVGQAITQTARPLKTIAAKQGIPDWTELEKLIKQWQPHGLIVGLPRHIDDSEQFTTKAATKFANRLHGRFGLPTHLVDERLTTVEARQRLFDQGGFRKIKQSEVDSHAAQIILEQWLREGSGTN